MKKEEQLIKIKQRRVSLVGQEEEERRFDRERGEGDEIFEKKNNGEVEMCRQKEETQV